MNIDKPSIGAIVRLRTHLSPEECWARLDTIASRRRYFLRWGLPFGSKRLLACRRGENLVLAARKPFKMPYPYWFYGRIVADGEGALIEGEFAWPRQTRATLAVVAVVWPTLLIAAFLLSDGEMGKPKILGMLCFMLVFPAVLIWYNVWYDRRMQNTVLPLLTTTLEATEA